MLQNCFFYLYIFYFLKKKIKYYRRIGRKFLLRSRIWFKVKLNIKIFRRVKNSRMGRGKAKLRSLFILIKKGIIFIKGRFYNYDVFKYMLGYFLKCLKATNFRVISIFKIKNFIK